jgi:hypothetical protein
MKLNVAPDAQNLPMLCHQWGMVFAPVSLKSFPAKARQTFEAESQLYHGRFSDVAETALSRNSGTKDKVT